MKFYLVRHAHAEWSSDEHRPLSERGHRDACVVADILEPFSIRAIVSSPYRRAVQTVEPLAIRKNLEIEMKTEFRERALGSWSTVTFEEAVRRTWEDPKFAHPAGETNREAQRRGVRCIREILEARLEDPFVVGTHGNLLALILNHFDPDIGYDFWSRLSMPDIYCLHLGLNGEIAIQRLWQD
jgi:broad specificity phosphatase PhoE